MGRTWEALGRLAASWGSATRTARTSSQRGGHPLHGVGGPPAPPPQAPDAALLQRPGGDLAGEPGRGPAGRPGESPRSAGLAAPALRAPPPGRTPRRSARRGTATAGSGCGGSIPRATSAPLIRPSRTAAAADSSRPGARRRGPGLRGARGARPPRTAPRLGWGQDRGAKGGGSRPQSGAGEPAIGQRASGVHRQQKTGLSAPTGRAFRRMNGAVSRVEPTSLLLPNPPSAPPEAAGPGPQGPGPRFFRPSGLRQGPALAGAGLSPPPLVPRLPCR